MCSIFHLQNDAESTKTIQKYHAKNVTPYRSTIKGCCGCTFYDSRGLCSGNYLNLFLQKALWWPNVDYLILEPNRHLVTMVLGILLACCLAVITILFLTRNKKYVCDHRKGTVHSSGFIRIIQDIVFLQTCSVLWHVSFVLIERVNNLWFLFLGTLSASFHAPRDSQIQKQQVQRLNILHW